MTHLSVNLSAIECDILLFLLRHTKETTTLTNSYWFLFVDSVPPTCHVGKSKYSFRCDNCSVSCRRSLHIGVHSLSTQTKTKQSHQVCL